MVQVDIVTTVITVLFVVAKSTAKGAYRMIDIDVLYDNKTKTSRCSVSGVVLVFQYGSVLSSLEMACGQHDTTNIERTRHNRKCNLPGWCVYGYSPVRFCSPISNFTKVKFVGVQYAL
jgi:hypothetical protein